MHKEIDFPTIAIINDLDALIAEIDANPQLSPWVVRLVLKTIKDKARNMVNENLVSSVSLTQPVHLEVIPNSSHIAKSPTRVLP